MSVDYKEELKELGNVSKILQKHVPGPMEGFAKVHHAALADGALSRKVKELMALAIGINMRCEGCIVSHARGAVKAGATPEEVAETVGVSILMGGGPATVYGAKALQATEAYREG